jgi:methyltransferase (TIGR00027 family)
MKTNTNELAQHIGPPRRGVSETALITLKARVIEAEKENPVIEDPIGLECLNRLQSLLPIETRDRILNKKLPSTLTRHLALRARKYDSYARTFIEENPNGMVVSLGCGFDTRYWRVSANAWKYVEVDLPEVIAVKKKVLDDIANYQMIGSSVLEEAWIERILSMQKENVLFLAEGLLMYLPESDVIRIFKKLSGSFSQSQVVFEVVHEKYTKGLWKKVVESKMKRALGTKAGSAYEFGVGDAKDVESYGKKIKVVEEWSYFEDPDIKPKFLRLFRNFKFMSRTQWTIKATIG